MMEIRLPVCLSANRSICRECNTFKLPAIDVELHNHGANIGDNRGQRRPSLDTKQESDRASSIVFDLPLP